MNRGPIANKPNLTPSHPTVLHIFIAPEFIFLFARHFTFTSLRLVHPDARHGQQASGCGLCAEARTHSGRRGLMIGTPVAKKVRHRHRPVAGGACRPGDESAPGSMAGLCSHCWATVLERLPKKKSDAAKKDETRRATSARARENSCASSSPWFASRAAGWCQLFLASAHLLTGAAWR